MNKGKSELSAPTLVPPNESVFFLAGYDTEEYSTIEENRFMAVQASPLSTFSIDVDTC